MRRIAAMAAIGALAFSGCSGSDDDESPRDDPSASRAQPCQPIERETPAAGLAEAVQAGLLPAPLPALASGNPFSTPLPRREVPLHPQTDQQRFREELRFMVSRGTQVEQRMYSASLYIVYRNGDVYDTAGRKKAEGAAFVKPTGPIEELNAGIDGRGWPLQGWMQPDPGEGHMAIYSPETGTYGEFIGAEVADGYLGYTWGGFIPDAHESDGMSSHPDPWWGATAFGLNLMSFTITDHEIRAAVARYRRGDYENAYIPHIIGYEAYRHHPNEWYYPATKTDDVSEEGDRAVTGWGAGGDPDRLGHGRGVIRMGGILRLSPSVDVQSEIRGDGTEFGDMMARIIARTMQNHGATMTDQSRAGFALIAEHVRDPGGGWDEGSFSYGGQGADHSGEQWLTPLLEQMLSENWAQLVYTGRNVEAEGADGPPEWAYRPPLPSGTPDAADPRCSSE